jgi:putative ABC transport system permease protein
MSWNRLPRRPFRTRDREARDLAEELQQHLDERIDILMREGLSREDARRTAHRELGGSVTLIEERGRDVWRWTLVDDAIADVRYALRQLRRAPSFALATILTLALGIGANTAVFSVINAVLLRPLPFPDADRLVDVRSWDRREGGFATDLSYPTFFDFRRDNTVFEHLVSYRDGGFALTGGGQPLQVPGLIVSWDLFPVLGIQPALGRGFLPEEEARGSHVAILSHALWTSRFGADPAIVGTSITLDGTACTVVGIAPAGFNFPLRQRQVQIWTTLSRDRGAGVVAGTPVTEQRGARMLNAIARLKPGETLASAQTQLDGVAAAIAATHADQNGNIRSTSLISEMDRVIGRTREPMLILFGAVALVLIIACANIANMLLARTADRERELGIRLAIGGSRARVIRQLLTENLCLSALGSLAGIAVALGALRLALPLATNYIPRVATIDIDARVLAFSVGLAMVTALVVSIPAAFRVARMEAAGSTASLRGRARGHTDEHDRVRGVLVIAQIAIGLVLSSGAGLLVADFVRLNGKDLGFRPDHLLALDVSLPDVRYRPEARVDFMNRLIERLRHTPGVTTAAAAMPLPLMGDEMTISFNIPERPRGPGDRPSSNIAIITPDYFETIGTPLLDGRLFTEHDDDNAPPVVIVNQAFAARFFPGEHAVGKRIEPGATSRRGTLVREIVGIVGNARQSALGPKPEPIYYMPFRQMPWGPPSLVVRTDVPPLTLESTIRQLVTDLDKDVPIHDVGTFDTIFGLKVSGPRFVAWLMGSFAIIALLLTAVGLYGVLTYAVLRRTREIGVRMALGATRGRVIAMTLRRAMMLVAIGVPLGLIGALIAQRLLMTLISEPASSTPLLLIATCTLVACTAVTAAYLPARRAASIDPTRALRTE